MPNFDYALYGSNLLSALLAGLLARDHGAKVVRVGRRPSAQRLPRQLDLALPFSARPDSWDMVRQAAAETRQLLAAIDTPEGWAETDVAWIADTAATAADLDHAIHLAHGVGHQVARLANGWALRRIPQLYPEFLGDSLAKWLGDLGVVSEDDGPVDAAQTVLCDDAALIERLPAGLASEAMTATLVVAPRSLPFPLQIFADRGVTLLRRPGNSLLALVSGESEIEARLASTLSGPFPLKRLATTRYRRVITDGAPLIGRMGEAYVIAGLGEPAAFLAPALARHLNGKAEGAELDWLVAHDPARPRAAVADLSRPVLP